MGCHLCVHTMHFFVPSIIYMLFNNDACGSGPFKLCLCGNWGSIYIMFQTYHIGVYQAFQKRKGNRFAIDFS